MKATLLQRNVLWASPQENARLNREIMEKERGTDLFLLPEMFSTGFATSPDGIAEELDEEGECFTLRWMRQTALEMDCAVCGSVAVKEKDGRFFNRLYFVTPDNCFSYDKHHLFTYGGENLRYSAGQERVVVFWRGVKILLQVCYDVRFPVFVRNTLQEDGAPEYDAIIYVASWPAKRVPAWKRLLPARAIENQCYVLAVNRVGNDPVCEYIGGTMVIDAMGNIVDSCPDAKETSISVDLDMEALKRFRSKFPVLEDGDGFCLF
ncbi:MAG: nitrilase family protein [Bacteroidales bacterium]|nr:nitrilase family protein [Bacteroidales bacterium]